MSDLAQRIADLSPAKRALLNWQLEKKPGLMAPIAIIGLGCRFPGAGNPEAFWQLLRDGVDAIAEVPKDRWDVNTFYDPNPTTPGKMSTRWGGFLKQVDQFDPHFFGISPREAARIDPQQRLLLEVAWEALEDAGQIPERLAGTPTGVFIGISSNDHGLMVFHDPNLIDAYAGTGNALSIAANRISYLFNFCGPSVAVDTACSSSLVAVHLACGSLWHGEATLALAGGVNLVLSPAATISYSKLGVMAPDGRCKAFDARAAGIVRSEGAGMVVLKPLSRAIVDRDPIYAIIRGSAVNNDGRTNGLTAPSRQAQEAVLREAYRRAGVSPGQAQYVEAHGTGTLLGDPIEANALGTVLAADRPAGSYCALASVKTNIGHLEAAAGIAGLIKVALMLKHREIPPSLHFREPNPHIPFDSLPLRVQTVLGPWPETASPALAGVSSFGFGGTNAHVVLEEAPQSNGGRQEVRYETKNPQSAIRNSQSPHLLPLSARSPEALQSLARAYCDLLTTPESTVSLPDICYTASVRRGHHDYRLAVVGDSRAQLTNHLEAFLRDETRPGLSYGRKHPSQHLKLAFVFSGQGSQWYGMGRQLLEQEPVFRTTLEQCDTLLRQYAEWSLVEELTAEEARSRLHETAIAQPAIFALQVALTALWHSWGVMPQAVVGHSVGELAAAHVAGVLSRQDAVRVSFYRGQVMQRAAGQGKMVAVGLSWEEAQRALTGYADRLAVAAHNSPISTVLSGDGATLAEVVRSLQQKGVVCHWLPVNYAFHSPQMVPLQSELGGVLQGLQPQPPSLSLFSTLTGRAGDGRDFDAAYWGKQIREPVLFAAAVKQMVDDGYNTFLEIGPHPVLSGAIAQCLRQCGQKGVVLPSLRRGEEQPVMLESLGALYSVGYPLDWSGLYPAGGRCLRLPSYPWQRERCWMESAATDTTLHWERVRSNGTGKPPLLGRRLTPAYPAGTHFWEVEIDTRVLPHLDDHRIQGVPVVPASVYVEMALAAASEVLGEAPHILQDITFHRALFLPEGGTRTVQVILSSDADGAASFSIHSRPGDVKQPHQSWTLHVTGKVCSGQDNSTTPVVGKEKIQEIRTRCSERTPGEEYYLQLSENGIHYGPFFQCLKQLWRHNGEVLGEVHIADGLGAEGTIFQFHPAILDACIQVFGATITDATTNSAQAIYLPTHIEQIQVCRHPGQRFWAYACLQERNADTIKGHVRLLDEAGQMALEILGLNFERLDRKVYVEENLDEWLYELRWQPKARLEERRVTELSQPTYPGSWLIFADSTGVGEALAAELASRGERPVVVFPGEAYECLNSERFRIRSTQPEDVRQLLATVLRSDQSPCRGVIHLWSLDAPPPQETTVASLEAAQTLGCGSVLFLVQDLAQREQRDLPRLWLVTRGAQAVEENPLPLAVAQAPLWGFGRVIAQEHLTLWGGLIDLDPSTLPHDAAAQLWEEIRASDREDQLAFRQKQRYVARLVRHSKPVGQKPSFTWRLDGSYLITGGLGDLGLVIARWMVEQGARRLILMGRTQLPPRPLWTQVEKGSRLATQIAAIRELEALGASVHVAAVDVTDEKQLRAFLDEFCAEGWPPIRGVVHAAGLVQLQPLVELDIAALTATLRPKMVGGWLLHHLLADSPLDFFVLFSSLASLLSSPRLGSYAAANAFLDALAHHRWAYGHPGLSINWALWADVGMAARHLKAGHVLLRGVESFTPKQGLEVLGRLLRHGAIQVGVMRVNWQQWRRLYPAFSQSPLLSQLVREEADMSLQEARTGKREDLSGHALLAVEPEERPKLLQPYLSQHVARALGLLASKLDVQQPLSNLGVDSLMAVELKNRIAVDLGVDVPVAKFLQGLSVDQLTIQVLNLLAAAISPSLETLQHSSLDEEQRLAAPEIQADEFNLPRYPLSHGQRTIWFSHQLTPEVAIYSIPVVARIRSELDVSALRRALQTLVDRHPSLRTSYTARNGVPWQQVHTHVEVSLREEDASTWSQTYLDDRLVEELHSPFDLERGLLLRAHVFSLSAEDHILLLIVHHIAVDFWSLDILLNELHTLYFAEKAGVQASLPPLRTQYTDYIFWQAKMLEGPEGEQLWTEWQKQVAGKLPVLNLPTDRPRPPIQMYHGATQSFRLNEELVRDLKALATTEGVTLYMTLLAAFQLLLHRYTGQDVIVVGTPTVGRSRAEFERIVGYFANPVPLSTDFSGDLTFTEVLSQVHHTVLAALQHQDYPVELLVERLRPPRDPSRMALFDVLFGWDKPRHTEEREESSVELKRHEGWIINVEELAIATSALQHRATFLDLAVIVIDTGRSLYGLVQYNTDLFDAATSARMTGHFQTLLEGIVAQPKQRVSDLPLLTAAEQHQLLVEWNNTKSAYPQDQCLHQIFELQVERTPDAVAVVFGDEQLTYQELNRRANQVAHYLQALGVGPEVMVGICMESSLEMVVGLLGILKVGGAYVPLDPMYPKERLAFMLRDAQVAVLLTQERLVTNLPASTGQVICLDDAHLQSPIRNPPSEKNPISKVTPDNVAYVMYTSGSTGQPKGVEICHRGVLRLLLGIDYVHLDASESILQMAPISFDASTFELWGALLYGARCVLFPDRIPTIEALGAVLRKHDISTLWLTAALYNMVIDEAPEILSGLRHLLIGGEALSVDHVRRGVDLLPSTQIINGYGPTESTTFTCCYWIPRQLGESIQSIPIGRPIGNTEVYLLDRNLRPVPIGVPGELCIGGDGLARGYRNRPDLTAEQFVPNPFSDEPGARLYKTGDLARYRPGGNIEFLGRLDQQVKLRGFRIELGEIEAVLSQHPAVRETVVMAREDVVGEKQLVAYVVPQAESALTISDLRSFLKRKLPEYMMPAAFVLLDALPLTPSGKVDRRALPVPDQARPQLEKTFVPPRDALEFQLTLIWEELLGVRPIGVRDDFFALGGHSLLALRLFAVIEKWLGRKLPLETLFQDATIEHLAGTLRQHPASLAHQSSLVAIQPRGNKRPLFLVHPIGGHVLCYIHLVDYLGFDQPLYGLQARGLLDGQAPDTRIEDMAAHYIQALRTVQPEGPYLLGGWSLGGIVAFEMAQQLLKQAQRVALLAVLDVPIPTRDEKSAKDGYMALAEDGYGTLFVEFARYFGLSLDSWESLSRLPKDELLTQVLEQVKKTEVMSQYFEGFQIHRFSQVLETNFRAVLNYIPHPYSGRVTLFEASEDLPGMPSKPTLGWGAWAAGDVEVHVVPGTHFDMVRKPHVTVLAERLQACLDQAQLAEEEYTNGVNPLSS